MVGIRIVAKELIDGVRGREVEKWVAGAVWDTPYSERAACFGWWGPRVQQQATQSFSEGSGRVGVMVRAAARRIAHASSAWHRASSIPGDVATTPGRPWSLSLASLSTRNPTPPAPSFVWHEQCTIGVVGILVSPGREFTCIESGVPHNTAGVGPQGWMSVHCCPADARACQYSTQTAGFHLPCSVFYALPHTLHSLHSSTANRAQRLDSNIWHTRPTLHPPGQHLQWGV
jgi:hypothetical protein